MKNLKPYLAILQVLLFFAATVINAAPARWRTVTADELRKLIPARAPVVKENIETEFRTASGVTDGKGKFIAGVVITLLAKPFLDRGSVAPSRFSTG